MSEPGFVSLQAAEAFVKARLEQVMTEWFLKGHAEGRDAERKRIATILSHPSVLGREPMALHLAYCTEVTPEQAVHHLESSPRPDEQQAN